MTCRWALVGNEYFVTQQQSDADLRESASVAHIYASNWSLRKSMTTLGTPGSCICACAGGSQTYGRSELAGWRQSLFLAHFRAPTFGEQSAGATLGPFGPGSRATRHGRTGAPLDDISRTQQLSAQQGSFAADVIYYYGQDSKHHSPHADHLPPVPEGYAFDFANG